jgi:hypothetical protein
MLFIDSDINFNPQDVIAMLALDKDVIGGPYPKKALKWGSVKKAVLRNPDIEPHMLEKVTGDYVFNPVKGTAQFSVSEPLEVLEIGTGFMMINRNVFPQMEKHIHNFVINLTMLDNNISMAQDTFMPSLIPSLIPQIAQLAVVPTVIFPKTICSVNFGEKLVEAFGCAHG